MNKRGVLSSVQPTASKLERSPVAPVTLAEGPINVQRARHPHWLFRAVWYCGNILLILAILLAAYSAVWEYSTRKYLKGFSDAVVPASASTEAKIEAILRWMSQGPTRQDAGPSTLLPDRDPTETLNYTSLLQVCGSATNAFVNLADSAGVPVRRLLLLDARRMTKHVVAEVLVDGRWIVVDPAFRTILRGRDGGLLTREELTDPAVFSAATQGVRGYDPRYTFDQTAHVRLSGLRVVGLPLRGALDRLLPGWEDSTAVSLLLERESLATMVAALILVFLLGLLRVGLRWYGERHLELRPVRVRHQVRRAVQAFVDTAS
jgi:Transglutaminase-like superfamily